MVKTKRACKECGIIKVDEVGYFNNPYIAKYIQKLKRLYIREYQSERIKAKNKIGNTVYKQSKPKAKWIPIGWYCPRCYRVILDKEFEVHEYANIFPLIEEDTQRLIESLNKNKYRLEYPIYIFEGKILEGRHRYLACKKTKIGPMVKKFKGTKEQALDFVILSNLDRRHLTPAQKADVAWEAGEYLEQLAKEKQLSQLKQYKKKKTVLSSENKTDQNIRNKQGQFTIKSKTKGPKKEKIHGQKIEKNPIHVRKELSKR